MTMSHSEKKPGRLFFRCYRRLCPFFQWVDQDPRGQNRGCFDGRVVRRTFQDELTETPLQKGVRKAIDQHIGPFEGNWSPEVTPKEQLILEQRGLLSPGQSDLKEVEWYMYK